MSGLDKYRLHTGGHCGEILAELQEYGPPALYEAWRSLDTGKVRRLFDENANAMAGYIASTPAERKKVLRKLGEGDRSLFLLGCAYHARCALALLTVVCRYRVEPGLSYRSVSGEAAQAAWDLAVEWPTLWPWEDAADPFDGA